MLRCVFCLKVWIIHLFPLFEPPFFSAIYLFPKFVLQFFLHRARDSAVSRLSPPPLVRSKVARRQVSPL